MEVPMVTPFPYTATRTVIQHMIFNFRQKLTSRCPNLKIIENQVQLRVQSLRLAQAELKMDFVLYNLKLVCRPNQGHQLPELQRLQNEHGGISYDVNEYGTFPRQTRLYAQNGEILLDFRAAERHRRHDADPDDVEEWRRDLGNIRRDRDFRRVDVRTQEQRDVLAGLDARVAQLEDKLIPYDLKMRGLGAPYKYYIKLSIIERRDGEVLTRYEYVNYDRAIHMTMNYLVIKLLGNRDEPIFVQKLNVYSMGVLHLPRSVQFRIRSIKITNGPDVVFDQIQGAIAPESFPLDMVEVFESRQLNNIHLQNARRLEIQAQRTRLRLLTATHRRVHVHINRIPQDGIWELITNWIGNPPVENKWFSFKVLTNPPEDVHELFDLLQQFNNAQTVHPVQWRRNQFPLKIEIPLGNQRRIHIYCERFPTNLNMGIVNVQITPLDEQIP